MTTATHKSRPATARDRLFIETPPLWPTWPFLPVVRVTPGGEIECGLLYDCWSLARRPGFSATVFLCNIFMLPKKEDDFLALPKCVYDTTGELLAGGWRVD